VVCEIPRGFNQSETIESFYRGLSTARVEGYFDQRRGMFILGMVLDCCPCVSLEVWILGGAIMRSGRKMSVNVLPSRSFSPGTGLSTLLSLLNKSGHSSHKPFELVQEILRDCEFAAFLL